MLLIINKTKKDAMLLSDAFYYMGILSRGVTPDEGICEFSEYYKAILVVKPEEIPDKDDIINILRCIHPAPIFSISGKSCSDDKYLFDMNLKNEFYCAKLYDGISSYFRTRKTAAPGVYRIGTLDASANLVQPIYDSVPLPFTKSETMILRSIIKFYPTPEKAKDILKYAFRESRIPDISNVRTHISIMNKKFERIGKTKLIDFTYNEGYHITLKELSK